MSYSSLLKQSATITRNAGGSKDPFGQPSKNPNTTVASGVACLVQMLGATEQIREGQAVVTSHRIFMPYGQDVRETDRVTVGSTTYEVKAIDKDTAGQQHHIEVMAKEVRTS